MRCTTASGSRSPPASAAASASTRPLTFTMPSRGRVYSARSSPARAVTPKPWRDGSERKDTRTPTIAVGVPGCCMRTSSRPGAVARPAPGGPRNSMQRSVRTWSSTGSGRRNSSGAPPSLRDRSNSRSKVTTKRSPCKVHTDGGATKDGAPRCTSSTSVRLWTFMRSGQTRSPSSRPAYLQKLSTSTGSKRREPSAAGANGNPSPIQRSSASRASRSALARAP